MAVPVLSFNSRHQQKCSQSFSSLIIPRTLPAQLLPPVETSEVSRRRRDWGCWSSPRRYLAGEDARQAECGAGWQLGVSTPVDHVAVVMFENRRPTRLEA